MAYQRTANGPIVNPPILMAGTVKISRGMSGNGRAMGASYPDPRRPCSAPCGRLALGVDSKLFAIWPRVRYIRRMQTQNPFLDEMAKLTQAAMGLAQAAGEEAKTAFRSQA